ncbi:GSCOCG00003644001-RA-CDS [Cotesia congregata]|nr:GSCOCG00003644001-RA-CDS [Cotesia congregata]
MNEHKTSQVFNLDPESELRFEVNEKDEKVTLELKNGLAEVFGAELIKGKKYEFGFGHKIGVFTWQGCTVEFTGKTVAFVEKKTPMALYLNCHAALERMREFAEKDNSTGPIVMIAGPQDVDHEKLYNALVKDIPDFVKVILLPKSSGVVNRGTPYRRITRNLRIDEYYYGTKRTLTPHSFDVKWSDVKIFSVGPLSNSQEVSKNKATKLIPVVPGPNLKKHILSISLADPNKDDIVQTNIAGFVCITNVDVAKQTMTILSPLPGPLPNNVLLLSSITYPDDK